MSGSFWSRRKWGFPIFSRLELDPLSEAIVCNRPEQLRELLVCFDPSTKGSLGFSAIQLAALLDRKSCLKIIQEPHLFIIPIIDSQGRLRHCTKEQFHSVMGVEYLSSLFFNKFSLLLKAVKKTDEYSKDHARAIERRWLGTLHKKKIEGSYSPLFSIRWIGERIGYGLYAEERLSKGSYIGEYTGEVCSHCFSDGLFNKYIGEYSLGGKEPLRFVINARRRGNYTRYINHSDQPNCSAITVISGGLLHVLFLAEEEIAYGQQITFDYGPHYWGRRKKLSLS